MILKNNTLIFRLLFCKGLAFLLLTNSTAQTLTFESAVQEMLAQNFDIQIQSNNKEIASELNNIGTAGFLPTVDANVNYEKSFSNIDQQYFDGREREASNAQSNALNATVLLNWTLFDGFRMFANKNILEAAETRSGYYLRAAIEEALIMLASLYYQIVQQQKFREQYVKLMDVSRERYELTQKRHQLGNASLSEVIQAFTAMNEDSVTLLRNETLIANLKADLNLLLARNVIDAIDISSDIPLDTAITLDKIFTSAATENVDLLIARENIRIAQNETKAVRSNFYPQAGIYAAFDYGKSTNDVGILQSNQSFGPSVGVFMNWNLFNGLSDYKNLQVSKIIEENTGISADKAAASNNAFILKSFNDYQLALKVLKLEEENSRQANENVNIAVKRFELGNINSVEFREIQLDAVEAQVRLLQAQYLIRINELEMKRLAGMLRL